MAKKYLNPSHYLDPTGRNFEVIAFEQGKPLSASELDLLQDVQGDTRARTLRYLLPSGFLTGSFWEPGKEDFSFGTEPNTFELEKRPVVHVNGWIFPLEFTGTDEEGKNVISLPEPPQNNTEWGTDFVYLEVWRALITEGDPVNKPDQDKLFPWGNVLADPDTYLDDDLTRTLLETETTGRVQVQYAIRSVRLQDSDDRLGYNDQEVKAQGPNDVKTSLSFQRDGEDLGLWVAGDGDPDNGLGAVDGYVYSIPICLVYRRNVQPFSFTNNGNGGSPLSSGTSDRPDGLFGDQIVEEDVQDMRIMSTYDHDFDFILEKNTSFLLNNDLRTWVQNGVDADWRVGGSNSENSLGTEILMADDILPYGEVGNKGGNVIGHFDGLRHTFTDRPLRQVIKISYGHGDWSTGTLEYELEGAVPEGVVITDVLGIRLNAVIAGTALPQIPSKKTLFEEEGRRVIIEIDPDQGLPAAPVELLLEVEIPPQGLSSHVLGPAQNFEVIIHKPSVFNGLIGGTQTFTDDTQGREELRPFIHVQYQEGPNREVRVTYQSEESPLTVTAFVFDGGQILLPELPLDASSIEVKDGNNNIYDVEYVRDYLAILNSPPPEGTPVEVEFAPVKPLPKEAGLTLYYKSPALQAVPGKYLKQQVEIEILKVPEYLYSVTASSGSSVLPFPYETPSLQIPTRGFLAEKLLSAPGPINVEGFGADTGMLRLSSYVPLTPVSTMTLEDPQSASGNSYPHPVDYYATATSNYGVGTFGKPLSNVIGHKTFVPVLVKLKEDTAWALKGSVVLAILTQYHERDAENSIVSGNPNFCVALYKVRGNPVIQ